jgi:hypothetical protein
MKNAVFWDVTPCGSCTTDVSEERSSSIIRVTRIGELETMLTQTSYRNTLREFIRCVFRLLVTANVVHSSPILVTLMMEAAFLRNVGSYANHKASYPRRQHPSVFVTFVKTSKKTAFFYPTSYPSIGRPINDIYAEATAPHQ